MLKLHFIGTHAMNASTYKHAVKCSMLYSLSFLGAAHRLISCSLSPLLPHTAFYKGFQPFLLSCYSSFSRNIRGKSSPPPISLQKIYGHSKLLRNKTSSPISSLKMANPFVENSIQSSFEIHLYLIILTQTLRVNICVLV